MSRCVACNNILKVNELLNRDEKTRDLCRECIRGAFTEYEYTRDKEYVFDDDDIIEYLTNCYNTDTM